MAYAHPDISLIAGDDWVIPGALLDANGPIDLTNATLMWGMVGRDGAEVIFSDVTLERVEPYTSGQVRVHVPRAETAALAPGYYFDTFRLLITDFVKTMWTGLIEVQSDPYGASE